MFDAYLIIDWSASSTPKTGKDSIWWCHYQRQPSGEYVEEIENPATRDRAVEQIREILQIYAGSSQRVLVGFDFAYGYPAGFAELLVPDARAPWRGVWQFLDNAIQDDARNGNNRYEVASGINRRLTDGYSPFWGCPESKVTEHLLMTKPKGSKEALFPEFRITEQGNATHSVWKLFYNGSVGGQVMLGLPKLHQLISDLVLGPVSAVWPFDTGLRTLGQAELEGCNILHAEIYPSMIPVTPAPDEVKDRAQVRQLAEYFSGLDERGELAQLFAGRSDLSAEERHRVESEEGWILGIGTGTPKVGFEGNRNTDIGAAEDDAESIRLKIHQKQVSANFKDNLGLRSHRAISWLKKAEQEQDDDARFIFLWIAFNAVYAQDAGNYDHPTEKQKYEMFFDKLVHVDTSRRLYDLIWKRYYGAVKQLIQNQYIFQPFWNFQKGALQPGSWEHAFKRSKESALKSLQKNDVKQILMIIFDRLYVLRNQMVHGGATWNSSVNREQVSDGATIMAALVPAIIHLMMDNHDLDWGEPAYPVIK